MGRIQSRLIRDESTVAWLSWYLSAFPDHSLVFPFGPRVFRTCFEKVLDFLCLKSLRLTPASMRAGGATFLLESGENIPNIRFIGAWSSEKAMACYLQEAEASASLLTLTSHQSNRLEQVLHLFAFLSAPPPPNAAV